MNKLFFAILIFFFSSSIFAQISIQDSTVQAIGYWAMQDTQSYDVSLEKIKIKNKDTISKNLVTYEVDIKVIDSTANSYTIEWFYKNYKIDTENALAKKLAAISNDISVKIKTDEFGAFIEITNSDEISAYLNKVIITLKEELKDIPNIANIINNISSKYSSKEMMQTNAIKDVLQFYTFHGAKYTLGEELEGQLETSNNFGGAPFSTDINLILDEIDIENDNFIIRSTSTIDSEQLTSATYDYLKKIGTFGDNIPARKNFPSLSNTTNTASRIHGETGWVIYSIETKEVKAEETTNIEERIIIIK